METIATDVDRTVEYRADRWLVGWLPYVLLVAAVGFYMAFYDGGRHTFPGLVVLLISGGFALFLLYRLYNPGRSRLTLSPAGLQLHVGGRDVLIPWREIQGVETADLKVRNRGRGSGLFPYISFRDCTMVKVPLSFYDEAIHVPSVFMQGPGWQGIFHPDGDSMRIALHHEQFCVTPREVRAPIEARWRAFRGRSHPASRAADASVSSPGPRDATASVADEARASARRAGAAASNLAEPVRFGSAALLATRWDMLKLTVALIVILVAGSNALGVWETQSQEDRRLERQAEAEEARKEKEDRDRQKKKWDEFLKDSDRRLKRM